MADIQKTIEIVFGAVDNTGSAMSSAASRIDSFVDKVSGVTAPLAGVGDALLKTEAAIVTMGAAMLAVATNEAAKFQSAVNEIGTLFGGNAEQAAAFGAEIQNFALESTQSLESITAATYSAISAGVDYKDSLDFINTAEQLAVAGKADLNATTTLLVSTLNAYGASTDQAAQFSDALFQAVKIGQTTIPELSSSLAQVTGVAAAAGVPFDTLAASVAALTVAGLPTSQAITGLKAAISSIIQPSKEASDQASALGIQFDAAALKTLGLEGVLKQAYTATNGNVTAMGALFGSVEGLNAALILGADKAGKFAGAMDGMKDKAGSTQAAYDLMAQNFESAMQKMQNALTVTLQTAGGPLLDEFGGVVAGLGDVFKALKFSIDAGAFDPIYDALAQAANGLTEFLNGVAAALPEALNQVDFGGLASAFQELAGSIGDLFGDLDLTKPEDLAKAIQFVVDSVESLTTVVDGMVESWGPAIEQMFAMVDGFNKQDEAAKKAAGSVLGISQQFEFFKGVLTTFASGLDAVGTGLEGIAAVMGIKLAGEVLPKVFQGFGFLIGMLGQAGLVGAAGAAGFAVGTLANDGINALISKLTGSEQSLGSWIFELIHGGDEAEKMGGKVKAASTEVDAIGEAANKAAAEQKALEDAIKGAGDGADGFVQQTVKVTTATGEFGDKVFQTQEELDAYLQKLDDGWAAQEKLGQVTADTADTTGEFIKVINDDGTVSYAQNLTTAATGATNLATATDKAAAAAEKARQEQEKWNQELQKMAFEERMQSIESATEVTVASIEAESNKAVAAFTSIGESVSSTNDLIGKLFSTDAPDWDSFGFNIKEAADDANERANELTKAQIKLIETQIEAQQIKNDLLREGMPQIVIQADGLEPHIEAFMFQILNKIQVRASQLGAEWLVGGGMVGA